MEKVPFLKKISVSLLCILLAAGAIFFYEAFKGFTSAKASQILWATIFGIGFAYTLNYKLELSERFINRKKGFETTNKNK